MTGTVRALISGAVEHTHAALVPAFEAETGLAIVTTRSSTNDIVRRMASDEPHDLVISTAENIARFIANGSVQAASRADLVRSAIGLAVKAGAPRPDIGSGEAVKRALLAARSVGYSQGPSGVYLLTLFETMGIAAAIRAKAVQSTPGTPVARYVAEGAAEIGFQQISEMIHESGIDLLGPLPADIQHVTVFSSGILTRATNPAGAGALQRYWATAAAAAVIRRNGLEPA
jgi:molybdate transport system substrate-binding protein